MEIIASDLPVRAASPPASAYPTIKESWGVIGWFVLVMLVVGVPLYLLAKKAFFLPPPVTTVVSTVGVNLALLVFLRWNAGERWHPLHPKGQEQLWLYAALPVLVAALVTVLSLLDFLHLPSWTGKTFQTMMQMPVVAFIMVVVAAPVLEEVLFRGVVLQGLLRNERPWVAIGQSALLFGLFHFNPAQSLNAGLAGLLLGWLYYRTRSLWLCMAAHALNNLLAFSAMWLAPTAWESRTVVEMVGSVWLYAGVVMLSLVVLTSLLWWVQKTTYPATPEVAEIMPEQTSS